MKRKRKPYSQPYPGPYCSKAGHAFITGAKTGVLLLNMGGPDGPESVKPFLLNLFSDPDILKLPQLIQPWLARYIVWKRGNEAIANYAKMPGGGSPQKALSWQQAQALEHTLNQQQQPVTTALAMRYWHPLTQQALKTLLQQGVCQLVVVTLYPHFSYTTTGSNLNELRRALKETGWDGPLSIVAGYSQTDWYIKALAQCIQQGLNEGQWSCPQNQVHLLFSAHSLPVRHCKRTGDPYEQLTRQNAQAVMRQYFPTNPWDIGFQSKVGNFPWLGPPTDGVLAYYAGKRIDNVLVVPISFVSDHIETLVELDIDYLPEARQQGIAHLHRAPVMNTEPAYIQGLASAIQASIQQAMARAHPPELSSSPMATCSAAL
ncbi:MAG: ferrochelatase [Vampirovibrionales bacterium]